MLAKLLLPKIAGPLMGALASAVVAGGVYHWWTVSSLEETIRDHELSIAIANEELARSRTNNTKLQATVDKQNSELEALLQRAKAAESQNEKRLTELRRRWEAEWKATLPVETAEEANQWFEQQYSPR